MTVYEIHFFIQLLQSYSEIIEIKFHDNLLVSFKY